MKGIYFRFSENRFIWLERSPKGLAFIQGDLQFLNDSIRIIKGGTFRIRSHLSFDSINNVFPKSMGDAYIITHMVVKMPRAPGLPVETLMTQKLVMKPTTYESSDLDLTVKLHVNESVAVIVNSFRFVYNYNIANTFEIQKISNR